MKTVLFIFCFAASGLCYPQTQQYTPKVQLAIETYAFIQGQKASLAKVAAQFPVLAQEVKSLEKKAQAIYGRAEKNIEQYLRNELKDDQFSILKKNIRLLAEDQLKEPIQKKEHAIDFLETVRDKIELDEHANIPKGIISFAYHDVPHQEIIDGHIKNFTTAGHPKADESIVTFPVPKSWIAQEAEMPSAVKQFTSCHGMGNEKIVMLIHTLAQEERNLLLNEKSVSEMIPPSSRVIRTEAVTIDNIPGVMVEVEEILDYPVNKMKVRMMQFMFTDEDKLYCLQGSIGPVAMEENVDHQLRKYEPLFRLVAEGTEIED